jgi:hypothetical protein
MTSSSNSYNKRRMTRGDKSDYRYLRLMMFARFCYSFLCEGKDCGVRRR